LKSVVGEDIELVVCGNKSDLERNRQVQNDEALAYCKSVGAQHFVTSAKLNKNVADAFVALTRRMVQLRGKRASISKPRGSGSVYGKKTNEIRIIDDEPVVKRKDKCC